MVEDNETKREGLSLPLLAAAMLVGAVIVLGLVLSAQALLSDGDETSTPPPPTSTSTTPSPTGQSGEESVCGLEGHEKSGGLSTAPDASWKLVEGVAIPSVEGSGPGVVEDDGFRYCYARTREGAVLAVANFSGMAHKPSLEPKVIDKLMAPGPGRDIAKESATTPASSSSPDDSLRIQIAGVRLVTYSSSEATVDLLLRASNGKYMAQQLDVRWVEGDWRVVIADNGELTAQPRSVPDATGYLTWSGA